MVKFYLFHNFLKTSSRQPFLAYSLIAEGILPKALSLVNYAISFTYRILCHSSNYSVNNFLL
jgi:hypothetical protein